MKTILKIVSFCTGCFFVFLLAIGSYSAWFEEVQHHVPSPYKYGDLYLLSNLKGYRVDVKSQKLPAPAYQKQKNTALTIIGDSYLASLDSSYFNAGKYTFIHWNSIPDTIQALDKSKKNILIVESTERYIRWRFIKDQLLTINNNRYLKTEAPEIKLMAEDNLQYMLTHFGWEAPFKELKTRIYLNEFNRYTDMVTRPDSSGRLYLNETVDPKNSASSFAEVPDSEVENMVQNLNKVSAQLMQCGFDEVCFSIIPNAASVYKNWEKPYNHLIERIENHPKTQFKFIDIYTELKQEKNSVFYFNDSHWNHLGVMHWIIKANKQLNKK
ncbi:MAG: hypothetical protein JWP12_2233 [Bacteroidetes bacterium]|nr:hypothetical protein [Bacteroidota bacterium]